MDGSNNGSITITLNETQLHNLKIVLEVGLKTMGGPMAEFYLEMMNILKAGTDANN